MTLIKREHVVDIGRGPMFIAHWTDANHAADDGKYIIVRPRAHGKRSSIAEKSEIELELNRRRNIRLDVELTEKDRMVVEEEILQTISSAGQRYMALRWDGSEAVLFKTMIEAQIWDAEQSNQVDQNSVQTPTRRRKMMG